MKQSVFFTLLSAMLMLIIGVSWAGPGYGRYGDSASDKAGWDKAPGKALNLTEEQRTEIRALREAERERLEPLRAQLNESREAMRQMLDSDPVDENRLRELARAHADLKVDMQLAKRQFHDRMETILTPEQVAMRDERRRDRAGIHGQRHGRDDRGGKSYRHRDCGNFPTPVTD